MEEEEKNLEEEEEDNPHPVAPPPHRLIYEVTFFYERKSFGNNLDNDANDFSDQ